MMRKGSPFADKGRAIFDSLLGHKRGFPSEENGTFAMKAWKERLDSLFSLPRSRSLVHRLPRFQRGDREARSVLRVAFLFCFYDQLPRPDQLIRYEPDFCCSIVSIFFRNILESPVRSRTFDKVKFEIMNKFYGFLISSRKFSGYSTDTLIFRQLFDHISSTYTYLLGCGKTRECILIDPVLEQVKRDFQITQDLKLNLKYAVNTHMHADHVTGTGYLRALSGCKTIISKNSGAIADIFVHENDQIVFGNHKLKVLSTPGHTNGCVTYYSPDQAMAFTGDALLIRGCGRTDFQEGNPRTLYRSVHNKIFSLPRATLLFPAHDYKGQTCTSVDEEKRLNPRLTRTEDEFVGIMNNLNLDYPKQIDRAIPANKVCGVYDIPEDARKEIA